MARRLRPFVDSVFLVTVTHPSEVVGEVEQFKFHARGHIRAWSRLLDKTTGLFSPPTNFTDEEHWQAQSVSDPRGVQIEGERVTFGWSDISNSITAERVLLIEESETIPMHTVAYNGAKGQQKFVRFDDTQLEDVFEDVVQVNLSGQNQWIIELKVKNRRLRSTLEALDALVGYTPDDAVGWNLTGEVGTVV